MFGLLSIEKRTPSVRFRSESRGHPLAGLWSQQWKLHGLPEVKLLFRVEAVFAWWYVAKKSSIAIECKVFHRNSERVRAEYSRIEKSATSCSSMLQASDPRQPAVWVRCQTVAPADILSISLSAACMVLWGVA